jgi:hypothetical protein
VLVALLGLAGFLFTGHTTDIVVLLGTDTTSAPTYLAALTPVAPRNSEE